MLRDLVSFAHMEQIDWHLDEHLRVPELLAAPAGLQAAGCQAISFRGPDFQGRPTRVFAWLGLPEQASEVEPVPAVVLVHGGAGTAFDAWVRMWTARGYAALAIDTCGCVPVLAGAEADVWRRLDDGGPAGWGGFAQANMPTTDRWNYHAVANVIRAHSLLRSLPEVDAARTAVTGISWGGYLSCLAAALDDRYRCAVPIYGCGYLNDSPLIGPRIKELAGDGPQEWMALWDPQHYLPTATCPMLFVVGTIDQFFIPPMWSPSTQLPSTAVTRSLQVGLHHSHEHGWAPKETAAYIDSFCMDGEALPLVGPIVRSGEDLRASLQTSGQVQDVSLLATADSGEWPVRQWQEYPAALGDDGLQAALPDGQTAAYFQVRDRHGHFSSSTVWVPSA